MPKDLPEHSGFRTDKRGEQNPPLKEPAKKRKERGTPLSASGLVKIYDN